MVSSESLFQGRVEAFTQVLGLMTSAHGIRGSLLIVVLIIKLMYMLPGLLFPTSTVNSIPDPAIVKQYNLGCLFLTVN